MAADSTVGIEGQPITGLVEIRESDVGFSSVMEMSATKYSIVCASDSIEDCRTDLMTSGVSVNAGKLISIGGEVLSSLCNLLETGR